VALYQERLNRNPKSYISIPTSARQPVTAQSPVSVSSLPPVQASKAPIQRQTCALPKNPAIPVGLKKRKAQKKEEKQDRLRI